jgi:hypothetical protein
MTLAHAALLVIIPAISLLAISVAIAALLGWIKRRRRVSHDR